MKRLAIACAGLTLLGGCGGASAAQQAASFATDYVDHARGNCCAPGLHAYDVHAHVSKVDSRWALVTLQARDNSNHDVGGLMIVLYRKPSGWSAFNLGTGAMGCGVPKAVQSDLGVSAPPNCTR